MVDVGSLSSDNSTFLSDIALPDGTVVIPGQSYTKTWRVKNTGTSTWGSGYQLAFIGGEQMGAPGAVNVPATAPGQTADISVNITAPSGAGSHQGNWQMRNSQGTFFGEKIWINVDVKVGTTPGTGMITVFDISPASPSAATSVHIVGRIKSSSDFRSMRFLVGNEVQEMTNFKQVGDQYEISYDWNTSSLARGNYAIMFEVARQGDTSWSNPERQTKTYTLNGTPTPVNRAPNRPSLTNPYDWFVYYSGNTGNLCAQGEGDPDGDAITGYYFDIFDSAQLWNSGWTGSNCVTTSALGPYTYQWRVKVRDGSGAESGWSDIRHFTLVNPSLSISELYFQPLDGNSEQVKIRTCTTGQGGIGITMRVSVNDANDGSGNGTWHIIKEQGSPCFNDIDAPVWNTLEYGNGPHRVRSEAHGLQTGWDGSAVREENFTLPDRRPPGPHANAPSSGENNGTWWNTRTIHFEWSPALRTSEYTLRVSTNPNPWADASPVLNQSLASSVTSYNYTFSQDYAQLYWSVKASNAAGYADSGGGVWFGIDKVKPTCQVQTLPATTYESVFQVNWSGTDNAAGVGSFNVQSRDSVRGTWDDWLISIPSTKTYELFTGQNGHTYSFRCISTDNAGNTNAYNSSPGTSITVDLFSRPSSPWWKGEYAQKRSITVLNNMATMTMPSGYPLHLVFNNSTNPTAQDVYNGSLSTPKCNDLRIVSNDSVELNRVIQTCSNSLIDIWFRSAVDISGGTSNNTTHQLYFGNASPGATLADPNQVWYPYLEPDTKNLYFFQEGSGSIAYDSSGSGKNCTIDSSVLWTTSLFGNGLDFNHANSGDSRSLNCGSAIPLSSFTIEFWYKSETGDGGKIAGELAGGGNGGGGNNWALSLMDGRIRFDTWPCPSCGSSDVRSDFSLQSTENINKWNHIAVSFNGGNEVKFFINGTLNSTKYLSQSGINTFSPPLEIGSVEGINQVQANMGAFRISSGVIGSFPYGSYAAITSIPTLAVGEIIEPPVPGSADLSILSLTTYPSSVGGILVEALVKNIGNRSTQNGFYTDLYLNHLPTRPRDYIGSMRFWVNDPIEPGETVTLTTLISDLSTLVPASTLDSQGIAAGSFTESSGMLYAQTDSAGLIQEPNNGNNIYSSGIPICTTTQDSYENDDTYQTASLLLVGRTQRHNADLSGDRDWIKFAAVAGKTYTIYTSNLGVSADTFLYLYDKNGTSMLASNDDYNGTLASKLVWKAPTAGTYYILIKPWNPSSGGCGSAYDLSLSTGTLPNIPTNLQASDGTYTDKVSLSWAASSGATSYKVFRAASRLGTKTLLGVPTVTTFNDTTATPGSTYYYWVKACKGTSCSALSIVNTGWRKLKPPTNLQASDGTYTDKVSLSWPASSGATSYKVFRAASRLGTKVQLGVPTVTTFNDTTATPGDTYYYWVKACQGVRCSDLSIINTGWRKLKPPTNLKASDGTYTYKVSLSWPASSGATSYKVFRAASRLGTKVQLGVPTVTTFNDTTATPGSTYYYWVKACQGARCSDLSIINTGWRKLKPPSNLKASDGTYTYKVSLSWPASSGATSYKVFRAASRLGTKVQLGVPTVTIFNDTTATPGDTYYYWVKACQGVRCSDLSIINTGWRKLKPPTNLQASDGTYTDKVSLSWAASSGATSYKVFRAASWLGTKTLLGVPTDISFDDIAATPGDTYYYWVKACKGSRCSALSIVNTGWRSK